MTNPEKLELSAAAKAFVGFSILMGLLLLGGNQASKTRKEQVYNRYAKEIDAYANQNREALTKLFTEIFPNKYCYRATTIPGEILCPTPEQVGQTVPSTLENWSSTAFIKQGEGGNLLVMELGGQTNLFSAYPDPDGKKKKVHYLLDGTVEKIDWEEYVYSLPGKEAIIPVKDSSGKIIGAIARGVIEESSIRR